MTGFLLCGTAMSIAFGTMIITYCCFNMNNAIIGFIIGTIISCTLGFGLCFCLVKDAEIQRQKWNNGICAECGTSWHFQGASGRNSSKHYYYVCENEHILETSILFQK
jgi:hypothetical protein